MPRGPFVTNAYGLISPLHHCNHDTWRKIYTTWYDVW